MILYSVSYVMWRQAAQRSPLCSSSELGCIRFKSCIHCIGRRCWKVNSVYREWLWGVYSAYLKRVLEVHSFFRLADASHKNAFSSRRSPAVESWMHSDRLQRVPQDAGSCVANEGGHKSLLIILSPKTISKLRAQLFTQSCCKEGIDSLLIGLVIANWWQDV
jgi:hypothetical protein